MGFTSLLQVAYKIDFPKPFWQIGLLISFQIYVKSFMVMPLQALVFVSCTLRATADNLFNTFLLFINLFLS
jgi:hypothetical protein